MTALSIQDVFTPATAQQWFQRMIDNASEIGLTTTAWQSGGVARSIIAITSYALQYTDVAVSLIAQGGFLDFAASGTISYVDAAGKTVTVAVTPEGGPGWLDILADARYGVLRIDLTYAGGPLAVVNTSVSTYGPFAAGTYHVSNPNTKQSYSNTASLTIPPSSIAGASVTGVGSYFGAIQITTASAHGLTTGDAVAVLGVIGVPPLSGFSAWYVTVVDSLNFTLQGSVFSGAYTSGGTVYVPTIATVQAATPGTVANSLNASGLPDVNTVSQPVTSLVGVSVSNLATYLGTDKETNLKLAARCKLKLQSLSPNGPGGAYEFFALSSQQLAPTLGPPQKVGSAITRVRTIQDPPSGAVYVFVANQSGGSSPEDVAATEAVLRAKCVPNAVTCFVAGATNKPVLCAMTVWLPAAYNTPANKALLEAAVQTYFQELPIGGITDPQGGYANIVPIATVMGIVFDVAEDNKIPVQNLAATLNGSASNLQLGVNPGLLLAEVAVLSPAVPQLTLVSV